MIDLIIGFFLGLWWSDRKDKKNKYINNTLDENFSNLKTDNGEEFGFCKNGEKMKDLR